MLKLKLIKKCFGVLTLCQAWGFLPDPTHCRQHCKENIHSQQISTLLFSKSIYTYWQFDTYYPCAGNKNWSIDRYQKSLASVSHHPWPWRCQGLWWWTVLSWLRCWTPASASPTQPSSAASLAPRCCNSTRWRPPSGRSGSFWSSRAAISASTERMFHLQ